MQGFLEAMVNNFRDVNSARVAEDALKSFKQGSTDLIEFNAAFHTMAAHTSLSIDSQLESYEANLSPAIFGAAIGFREWACSSSLDERMLLAVEAAAMASCYATLPADHPFSTCRSKYNVPPPSLPTPHHHANPIRIPVDPNAMQVDAITANGEAAPALKSAVRRVCWGKHLCFTCLGPKFPRHNQPIQFFLP